MSWIKEEERLLQWAVSQSEPLRENNAEDTYWRQRDDVGTGIEELGFSTYQELQKCLGEKADIDEKAILLLGTAAMKGKNLYYKKEQMQEGKRLEKMEGADLPDYVYMF